MMDFHHAFYREGGRLFWLNPPKEHVGKAGSEAGYICRGKGKNKDYWQVRVGGQTFKRSRVIFFMVNGRWPEPCVDHINGDSIDDDPANLREATRVENARNQAARRGKASGLPQGVTNYRGKFRAQIHVTGKRVVIGAFATPEAASAAYVEKRKEVFGEFA